MRDQPATLDSTYLALLDSVDAAIYVADMQTYELLFMNKMAREASGGSLGGTCWATLQADQNGPCPFCTNDRLLDKNGNPKNPYVWEFQNTINGEWYECRDQAVQWHDGRLVRMEIATNITARKMAEKTIRTNEERFRELFENMSSGVAVYKATDAGQDFIITNFNRAAEKIERVKRNDIIGHKVTEVFPGAEDFGLLAVFQRVWKTGKPENHPVSIYHDKRIQGWRDNYIYKLPSGEIVASYDDVTTQKKAEEALRESEESLRATLNSIGDAVIATDINHKIIRMNPIAERLTGWKADEALGESLLQVFNIVNARTRQVAENPVDTVLKTGKIASLARHTILLAKDGREAQIADSAAPIHDKDAETTGVVLVFRDVTEEYQMHEELQKTQQLEKIGTLAGGIAHDFNNILSGIFGNIAMAKRCAENDHPCIKYLDQAEISAERAKNLTEKLLTFAKGGIPIKGHISLGELVNDVVGFDLSGSNVKLSFKQADNLWAAEVDRSQIEQVFSNLAINAFQAMPEGGTLHIDLQNLEVTKHPGSELKEGKYIQATICDEGEGIDEKYLLRIFDPFFSTKQTGRGLGLATVYSIITKHDGHIKVSSHPGRGTTFTLYLPAVNKNPAIKSVKTNDESRIEGRSIKVLIMDDEETIRTLTTEMLKALGCIAEATTDGATAIQMYGQAMQGGVPYDLVIMDLTIPGGMGGKDAIKSILNIDSNAKAIVSSGYADDPIMAHHTEYGFKGVVTKPYTQGELKLAIGKALKS
ncbi:MAG: PAS domain S-box protein [Desulfuromusa sp.]|nr:PAS domain S-box protein [Desulfuromusa sp.]